MWVNSRPAKTRSWTCVGYAALCFSRQHGETSSSTRKHLVSLVLIIATLRAFIKKSREVQKRQQKAPVWFHPLCPTSTVCIRDSLNTSFLCVFSPNFLKVQFTGKCHCHRFFFPSFPPPQRNNLRAPRQRLLASHATCQFPPKSSLDLLSRHRPGKQGASAGTLAAEAGRLELAGIPARSRCSGKPARWV